MMDKNMNCIKRFAKAMKSRGKNSGDIKRTNEYGRLRKSLFALVAVGVMGLSGFSVFADDTTSVINGGTVPQDEGYSATVNTVHGNSYNVPGVYQSNSPSSITSFGSALPLSTIYINQDKIWGTQAGAYPPATGVTFTRLTTDPGIVYYPSDSSGPTNKHHYVAYDPTISGATALRAGQENVLPGPLFSFKFADAAEYTDANGNLQYGDVVFTYSNAKIFIDQRYLYAPNNALNGLYSLATGAQPTWGTSDSTNLKAYNSHVNTVIDSIKNKKGIYDDGNVHSSTGAITSTGDTPQVGGSIDISISVVDKSGVPVPGSFAIATTGINLDRSPRATGNNVNKALWYYYKDYPEYYYFAEAMSVNSGQFSENIYVRNNDTGMSDGSRAGFYPNVITDSNGNIKFRGDSTVETTIPSASQDGSFTSGFVTLGNAATGISLTSTGHSGAKNNLTSMNSPFFNSKQFWYKYKSTTGPNGNIQTTQEGNAEGKLTLTGSKQDSVLGQGTYVIMEGKTVKYTMTPDYGYKIKTLQIAKANGTLDTVTINTAGDGVNKMKKGDVITWPVANGRDGTLKYELDGTYTFEFPYAEHDEEIHVEWEPTTADILVTKAWYDDDDKDGMRKGAFGDAAKWPQVKLQRSLNGGLTWSDVTTNAYGDSITALDLPSGANPGYDSSDPTSKEYLDGISTMDNNTSPGAVPHPYTWEYLPMYQYDSNGKTAGEILYRIVEGTPTQLADSSYETSNPKNEEVLEGYRKPTFYDVQQFNLIADETKTIDGLQIYRNAAGNEYVLKSDNKYYPVTNWEADDQEANPQPAFGTLTAAQTSDLKKIDVGGTKYQVLRNTSSNSKYRGQEFVVMGGQYYRVIYNQVSSIVVTPPTDTDELNDFNNMINATLNGFNTADKADPYKSVAVRNEHDVSDIDVEVTKEWNDSYLWDSVNNKALDTTTPNGNAYSRRDIKFTLHGTINNGTTVIDLDESDPNTTDLTINLSKDELNARVQTANGETVYIDTGSNTATKGKKYVRQGSGSTTDPYKYYEVISLDDANNQTMGSYANTAADPKPQASDLEVAVNTAYKVDGSHFGVIFEGLQAYHEGQLIKYTVTESLTKADSFTVTGGTITQVTDTDSTTGETTVTGYAMTDLDEVKENQDLKGYKANFTNTPIVEDKYEPLPVKIKKVDEYTGEPLANAEFTVYTDPAIDEKPDTSTYKQIDGLTVLEELEYETYTDAASGDTYTVYKEGKTKYVRKAKVTDPETYDYYLYDNGAVDFTAPAATQPTNPSVSYTTTGTRYVKKTDGKYYAVTGNTIASTAADSQPDAAFLSKEKNRNYKKVTSDGVEYDVLTDKKGHNYIEKNGEYFEVDLDGNVASKKADPQPQDPSNTLTKVEVEGEVDEIVVVTDANGEATVTFNRTGIYTIIETGAPAGYTADTDQYQFDVSKELKEVKYLGPNDDHDTHWWQRLYDLIFGSRTNTKDNWKQTDKRNGTLTVEDTPVTANVLVRKVWDDKNDQDGVRPSADANLPTMILQYTLKDPTEAEERDWKTAQIYNPNRESETDPGTIDPGMVDVDSKKTSYAGGAIHKDNNNAYTWTDLPAYRDGKVVYYRIKEEGTVINDGTYTITSNKTVATGEESFKLVDSNVHATNQIVEVINTHTPQILNINATKHWIDNNNALDHRSKKLKIALYRDVDNQETKLYELTLDGNGAKAPNESDFDKDGNETLDDTTPVYDLDDDGTPETTEKGAYDAAVAAATAELNSGAYELDKTDDNTWNAIFKDLPAYSNGAPIKYRLEETLEGDTGTWYVNKYYVNYTKTDNTAVDLSNTDSLIANDVKRTFNTEDEEIKVGNDTYKVYIKNGKKYVRTGAGTDESPYVYHEIASDGSVDITKAADPQPKDPVLSKITTETTTATLRVDNTSKNNVTSKKYWLGGANANIRYHLYRTSVTQYVNKNDASDKISRAKYNALPDAQKADYEPVVPALESKTSTADPIRTGNTVTVGSDTYDVYNHANGKRYVDKSTTDTPEWHELTGDGTTADPYAINNSVANIKIKTWTPYDLDSNGDPQYVNKTDGTVINKATYDGLSDQQKANYNIKPDTAWERVTDGTDRGEHLFVSSAFTTSLVLDGDDETHIFENLPDMDPSGNPYVYRIFETTTAGSWTDNRFEGHYSDDGLTVTNINRLMEEGSSNVDVLKDLRGRDWDAKYNKTSDDADRDVFYFWIEPIKGVDPDTGEIIEFSDSTEDQAAKAKVPLPGDRNQYGRARSQNTAVGTTAREVSFSPILYDATDIDTTTKTSTFYYKVYESKDMYGTIVEEKDEKGITYDGTFETDAATGKKVWKPKTEVMKVVATADANNVVTTQHSWEKITKSGNTVQSVDWTEETPVFKNKYSSSSDAIQWIEKNIQSREWVDYDKNNKKGDAFQFDITSIAGANLNVQGTQDDSYTTKPLVKNADDNPQKDLQQLSTSMWAFGVKGNPYTGDMLGSNGEAYFIYEITEKESATSDARDNLGLDKYTVDGLDYDSSKIYAKVKVSDNWDGTLSFDIHYYTDASCKQQYEITKHKAWIVDKILTEERYVKKDDPSEIKTPDEYNKLPAKTKDNYTVDPDDTTKFINKYDPTVIITAEAWGELPTGESKQDYKHDTAYRYVKKDDHTVEISAEDYKDKSDAEKANYTNRLKRLLTAEERAAAERMKKDGNTAGLNAAGYREVNIAHFENIENVDIPVKKQWIGGPAVEDVTLHLERHLFPLSFEDNLDGESSVTFVEKKYNEWKPDHYINKTNYANTITKEAYDALSDTQKANYELCGDFWQRVGYVYDVKRGEFIKSNGKPKYDLLPVGGKTSTKLIKDEEGFNKDLPKYVVKNGITYRAVYMLYENNTSDAYTREYDPQYYINENSFKDSTGQNVDALIVKNTVVAQNKTNIAAVKQLQGRRWLTSDDFEFELTPYGVAVYDDNDNITRIDSTDAGKAKVPMPADDTARYSKTTTTGYVSKTDASVTKTETEYNALPDIAKSNYEQVSGDTTKYVNKEDPDDIISAEAYNALADGPSKLDFAAQKKSNTHAKTGTTTVDPNGNLERLARFGEITYTAEDLVYGKSGEERLQGDFFYVMKEKLPTIVTEGDNQLYPVEYTVIKNKGASNETTETKAIENKAMPTLATGETLKSVKFSNGITYDCDEHYVHVRVREDRTKELSAQIAYDEPGAGTDGYKPDITKGTQFTPVYTNRYDAEGLAVETVNKYIMGRDWEENETFDFLIQPLGNAPFFDEDGKDIGDDATVRLTVEDTSKKIQSVDLPELQLSIRDLPWTVGANGAKDPRGIGTEKKVKYSNGDVVPEGTRYGRFVYAIRETAASSDTLQKDDDTEYIRLTVIDKGDGTLDTNVAVFEDRYCTVRRYDPEKEDVEVVKYVNKSDPTIKLTEEEYNELIAEDPDEAENYEKKTEKEKVPATKPTFVNQLKRDLSVTKAWAGVATSDVVLKLQWSVNGENYWDVETTDWFNVDGTRIIKKGATGDALTITWEDLPAYSNITNPNDNGNDTDLDDMWIYYQVVEEPVTNVFIRYNEKPYVQGETLNTKVDGTDVNKYQTTPFHTGEETTTMYALKTDQDTKISEKAYNELSAEGKALYEETGTALMPVEDRVKDLYVTNFPDDISGKTRFGVVKQYIGKAWDKEEFTFVATPYESKLGDSNEFIKSGKYYKKGKKPDSMSDAEYEALDGVIYENAYNKLDPAIQGVYSEQTNNMPGASAFTGGDNTATAKKAAGVDPVSVNEYPANFKDLTIHRSDLAPDGQGGMKGEFVYKIVEKLPENAVKSDEYKEDSDGNKWDYYVAEDEHGNKIKYTTEEHFVHIVATDDGSGKIVFTVSYDDRETDQYVPVYTNYALMETPIEGTKTWIGGKDNEHINGTVTLDENDPSKVTASDDDLELSVKRKLNKEGAEEETLTEDDAGRPLKIVWAKVTPRTVEPTYEQTQDEEVEDEKTYYSYDSETEEYTAVTPTGTENPQEQGWYEQTSPGGTVYEYEKQETGNGTYTIMAVDKDNNYVAPFLNSTDNDGYTYNYYVKEGKVPTNYKASEDDLDVTNTYDVKDSIKVTKTWDDAQNKSGLRPDSVTVHLYKMVDDNLTDEEKEAATKNIKREKYATEEEYQADIDAAIEAAQAAKTEATDNPVQVEVAKKVIEPATGEKDEWTTGITWKDLPVYDENGDIIKYVVTEESVTGYTTTYNLRDGEYKEEGDKALIIELDDNADAETIDVKNSLTPATDEVKVEKVWDDNNNAQGKRPASVKFELYKYVYDKAADAYDKTEKKVTNRPATAADVEAAKAADQESNLKAGDDIPVPDLVLDGKTDTENLVNYEEAAWKGIWKNLPRTENGKTVLYIVKEVTTGDDAYAAPGTKGKYTDKPCISGDQVNGYKVTNTYTPDTTTAKVTKKWVDNQNALNSRPSKLTMTLMCKYEGADGQPVHEVAKVINGGDIKDKISADDEDPNAETWVYEVKNLPKYTKVVVDGRDVSREYTYYWKETVPAGYTPSVAFGSDTSRAAAETGKQTVDNNKTITNTYITGTLTVTKTWDDAKNSDGVRPSADDFLDKVTLFAGNTKVTDFGSAPKVNRQITPSSGTTGTGDNQNIYTIKYSNLPVLDKNGAQIIYSIKEDAIDEYTIDVAPTATTLSNTAAQGEPAVYTGGINLTNKHDYETTDIEITKNWYDQAGFRHEKAEIFKNKLELYADGTKVTDAALLNTLQMTPVSAGETADKFIAKWTGLPKYKKVGNDLVEIVYTVKENGTVTGYAAPVYNNKASLGTTKTQKAETDKAYNGGEINNNQLITVDVEKTWDDNSDHDNQRPEEIKIKFFRNGIPLTTTFGGPEVTLKKDEAKNGGTFTDNNNVYKWTKVLINLPYADANGTPYNYTAVETEAKKGDHWYSAFVGGETMRQILLEDWNDDKDTLTYKLTNKDDEDKVSFAVDKIWSDSSNIDQLRPQTIIYKLYQQPQGGDKTQVTEIPTGASIKYANGTVITMANNGNIVVNTNRTDKTQGTLGRIVISGLPKYASGGKEITYTIVEDAVPGYNLNNGTTQNVEGVGNQSTGITVTNVHTPVSTSVTPQAIKAIKGRNFKLGGETFRFLIEPQDGAPRPAKDYATVTAGLTDGKSATFNLPEFTFKGADMADTLVAGSTKTFTYKLTEVNGGKTIDDLKYDDSELTLRITVTRKADGGLEIKADDPATTEVNESGVVWGEDNTEEERTFTNEFTTTTNLLVRKIWEDKDADRTVIGSRPTSVTVVVTAEASVETQTLVDVGFTKDDKASTTDKVIYTNEYTVSKTNDRTLFNDNVWQKTISGIPKLDAADKEIKYTVTEKPVPNYDTDEIKKDGDRFIIKNSYTRGDFTGTKVWVDDGKKHDNTTEVKLTVYRQAYDKSGAAAGQPEVVNGAHIHWEGNEFTITGLPGQDANGNTYTYWVSETKVNGYNAPVYSVKTHTTGTTVDGIESGGTITNAIEQEYVEIPVEKVWVGDPTGNVTVQLKKGDDVLDTHEFEEEGNYTFTRDNEGGKDKGYEKYDLTTGAEIQYTVDEVVPAGAEFTKTITGNMTDGFVVTNTSVKTTDIYAQKQWSGDGDVKDGRENVKFKLIQTIDGAKKDVADYTTDVDGESKEIKGTQTIKADKSVAVDTDAGTVSWPNLPMFDKDGNRITYTVEEISAPEGYTASDVTGEGTQAKPFIIKNTLNDETVDVPVRIVWDDKKDQEGERPDNVVVRVQVKDGDEWTEVYVKDGKLVDESTDGATKVDDATLSNDNNWKKLFKDLPANDANGNPLEYRVVEMDGDTVVDGDTEKDLPGKSKTDGVDYTAGITGNQKDGFVITNSYLPGTVSVTAIKHWYGDEDVKEDTRKDVRIMLIGHINDDDETQIAYIGKYKTIEVNKSVGAETYAGSVTWTGLPKKIDGQELIWTVYEDSVPGYIASVGQKTGKYGKTENGEAEFIVTNEYVGSVSTVTATKIWEDGNNRDGKRDDVWFQLYRKIGDSDEEKVEGPKKVDVNKTAADGEEAGEVKWTNLPEIIAETKESETEDYKPVDPDPEVDSAITEEWYEKNGDDYVKTTDATVQDGKTYYTKTTEQVKTEMPERAVVYWVKEVNEDGDEAAPDGYTSTVVQTEPGVFEARNIHVPETKSIKVVKAWNDDDDKDKIRPDHVVFRLKDGDDVVAKATLTEGDQWTYTFNDVPVKKNGKEIVYTVEEEVPEGYTASEPVGNGTNENPITITNTRNRKLVDVKVIKAWEGDAGHEAETRDDVKVSLVEVVDGSRKVIDTQTLTFDSSDPNKEMSYEWKSQPTYRGGKDITYEVTEDEIKEYTMTGNDFETDDKGNYTFTITNTYGHVASHDVIYVDPKNPDGKMIIKSDKYSQKEAQKQAQGKLSPPANPSHKGTKFIGWAVNFDEKDNWVLVAKYQDNPVKPVPTISYIDPQSGKVLVSKQTDDPSSVKAPADPKSKNMQFTGWAVVTDSAGNTMYLAQYECDCSNGNGGKDVDKSNVDTGDDAMLTVWMLLFVMAVSFMVLTMMLRNRGIGAARDTYKPKH